MKSEPTIAGRRFTGLPRALLGSIVLIYSFGCVPKSGDVARITFGDFNERIAKFDWKAPERPLRTFDLELLGKILSDFERSFSRPGACIAVLDAGDYWYVIVSELKRGPALLRVAYVHSPKGVEPLWKFVIPDA